jgi:hypothetical protein
MFRIPYIRAVIDDKRLTQTQIKALLAKTSLTLPPITRSAVANAFSEGGMLSDGSIKAAAASVDNGRYSMKSLDKALANCNTPLSVHARIEIKNILTRASLIK